MDGLLVSRQPCGAVLAGILRREAGPGGQLDERYANLAPALIRHARDGGILYTRAEPERRLDFRRVNILAARNVHVLQPIDDDIGAILLLTCKIAGAEPVS